MIEGKAAVSCVVLPTELNPDGLMRVKYKNPPINEVIVGAYFDKPIMPLRSEYVGLFWSEVRKELPKIQQQPELQLPMMGPPNVMLSVSVDEPYPMPRFWLVSEDDSFLVQLQKNAFIANWRKVAVEYPHYEDVKAFFDKYLFRYAEFLKRELNVELPNIQMSELAYSNLIEPNEYWTVPADTSKVIPTFSIPNPGEPIEGMSDFNYLSVFRMATDLTLNVSIRSGRKPTDANKPNLVFELRAFGALGAANRADADAWYDRARETIGRCFTAMTNPDIQRDYWQPT